MQKRFLTLMTAASAAVLLFTSCSKSNKQGRYIPSEAVAVLHVDGASLNEKLPWDEVKQNELFKKAAADTSIPAFAKSVMDNPENSGIDTKNDFEFFLVKEPTGGYVGIEGALKDDAKFKKFLTDANKNAKESSKDGYTYLNDGRTSIGFNKEKFIITVDAPEMNQMNRDMNRMSTDTSFGMAETPKTRDMMPVTANLFDLKEDASLAKNDKFTELVKTKGDAHVWYNAEMLMKGMNMGAMSAVANINKLTEGAIFTGTVSFDNGKINFDAKSYMSKDMENIYKKYGSDEFDQSMVKNIPSQNLAGMLIFNFKPEGIKEILKVLGMDGLANIGLVQSGITLDDISKAGKGDFLIAATDISKDTTSLYPRTTAEYYFAASIGDKVAFNKVLDAGKKMMHMDMAPDTVSVEAPFNYSMNDKYFVLTKSKASSDKYLSGTANTSFPFLNNISGGSFGGYVNFQYIINSMKGEVNNDSLGLAAIDASLKIWDNLTMKGGEFKGGGVIQHWEINMMDKNTNSLKQLNSYFATLGLIAEAHKKKNEEMWKNNDVKIDSVVTIPPPTPAPTK